MKYDHATSRYRQQSEMFKALAHPVRLIMLEMLRDRDWCVCELATAVGASKSVASKHLSQLKAVGLISDRKQGTQVIYHLMVPCILELCACSERTIRQNLRLKLDLEDSTR
jgi:DNA-binding transcriptional ArsR family regulator